jgi:hypothetical protein
MNQTKIRSLPPAVCARRAVQATLMNGARTARAGATAFEESYAGIIGQVSKVRADLTAIADNCPLSDNLVLLTSELAANAILHSRSGRPAGTFSVRVTLYPHDYAWVEIVDQGGEWTNHHHGRGLAVVAAIAGADNWGIDGDAACRVAWFRLDWPTPPPAVLKQVAAH